MCGHCGSATVIQAGTIRVNRCLTRPIRDVACDSQFFRIDRRAMVPQRLWAVKAAGKDEAEHELVPFLSSIPARTASPPSILRSRLSCSSALSSSGRGMKDAFSYSVAL